jgi:hypothetical protein
VKTLYLDHHILINDAHWDLLRSILDATKLRLVISSWNIIEIEQGEDTEQLLRRAEFITSLQPIFVHDMVTLQRYEIRNFLWLRFFEQGIFPYSPFSASYPSLLEENFGIKVRADYSLLEYFWAAARGDRKGALDFLDQQKAQHVEALRDLQTADRARLRYVEEVVFYQYVVSKLPRILPSGDLISP